MDTSTRTRERLWDTRQELYRLYDLEDITEWRARDLITLYELFEEFDLASVLNGYGNDNNSNSSSNSRKEEVLQSLHSIKTIINERISKANKDKDFHAKSMLTKKLDKVLTLIALVEDNNISGLKRQIATYRLLKRGLLEAINSEKKEEEYNAKVQRLREELEREIIELKKRLNEE